MKGYFYVIIDEYDFYVSFIINGGGESNGNSYVFKKFDFGRLWKK